MATTTTTAAAAAPASDIVRINAQGQQEVRTGLGWRRVVQHGRGDQTGRGELPVIDVGDMVHPDLHRRLAVAKEICDAAVRWGFFYVRNHHVPKETVDSIFHETRRFIHDLTLDEKMEYDTEKHEHYYGYYPIKLDPSQPAGAKTNEAINYGYEACADPESTSFGTNNSSSDNWWPSDQRLPGYEQNVKRFMAEVLTLSRRLLRMFALGLGLDDEHALDHLATNPYSILKMAHYPGRVPGTEEPSTIRPHTDFELLTVLLQDSVPSLEVLSPHTGEWIRATPVPDTFIVNIGDSLSILTNGLFVSTMHRVVNLSGRDRYSVPFFLGGQSRDDGSIAFDLSSLDACVLTRSQQIKKPNSNLSTSSSLPTNPPSSSPCLRASTFDNPSRASTPNHTSTSSMTRSRPRREAWWAVASSGQT
jgi:isopenicillin N synthase-like dioxygenase